MAAPPPDRIDLAEDAREDLTALLSYLTERNPLAASRFFARLNDTLALLAGHQPRLDGAPVTMPDGHPCRRMPVHPAAIVYDLSPGVLTVLRVYHHAREPITR